MTELERELGVAVSCLRRVCEALVLTVVLDEASPSLSPGKYAERLCNACRAASAAIDRPDAVRRAPSACKLLAV